MGFQFKYLSQYKPQIVEPRDHAQKSLKIGSKINLSPLQMDFLWYSAPATES